jgi:hypothetical protein
MNTFAFLASSGNEIKNINGSTHGQKNHKDTNPYMSSLLILIDNLPEPVLLNVYGALALIPRNEFRQPM